MNYFKDIKDQVVSTISGNSKMAKKSSEDKKKFDVDVEDQQQVVELAVHDDDNDHQLHDATAEVGENDLLNGSGTNGAENGHQYDNTRDPSLVDQNVDPSINHKADNAMLDPAITGDNSSVAAALAAAAAAAVVSPPPLSPKKSRKSHKKVKKEQTFEEQIEEQQQQILDQADAEALAASALSQSPLDTLSLAATTAAAETKPPRGKFSKSGINKTGSKSRSKRPIVEHYSVATTSDVIDENISPELAGAGGDDDTNLHNHHHHDTTHPDLVAKQAQQTKEFLEQAVAAAVAAGNTAVNTMPLLPGNFSTAFTEGNVAAAAAAAAAELAGPMSIASLTNPTPPGGISSSGGPGATQSARKKRQCSTCLGWFSNLATHRSTHLSDNSRPHSCEVCGRGFARPNDLFRHQKSHRDDAAFRCPLFVKASIHQNEYGSLEPACHQNGGFSRCDTYKNHLKAMHFEYPAGTKKRDRPGMSGKCKGCGLEFENADRWINEHIEGRECAGIKKYDAIRNKYDETSEIEAAAAAAAAAVAAVRDADNAAQAAAHHDPMKIDEPVSAPGPILPPSSSANLSETAA